MKTHKICLRDLVLSYNFHELLSESWKPNDLAVPVDDYMEAPLKYLNSFPHCLVVGPGDADTWRHVGGFADKAKLVVKKLQGKKITNLPGLPIRPRWQRKAYGW